MKIRNLVLVMLVLSCQPALVHAQPLSGGFTSVYDIAIDYDHDYIISAGQPIGIDDYNLVIWGWNDKAYQLVYDFKAENFTEFLSVTYAGNHIYAGGFDGKLFHFTYADGNWALSQLQELDLDNIQDIQNIGQDTLLVSDVWQVQIRQNNTVVNQFTLGTDWENRIRNAKYLSTNKQVVVRDFNGIVHGFDINSGDLVGAYGEADYFTTRPGTSQIATVDNHNITIMTNDTIVRSFDRQQQGQVSDMQFSTNSQYLAVAESRTVEVFDVSNGSKIGAIDNGQGVNTIEWYNNYQLYTGDSNGTVKLWNLHTNGSQSFLAKFGDEDVTETIYASGNPIDNLLNSKYAMLIGVVPLLVITVLIALYQYLGQSSRWSGKRLSEDTDQLYPEERAD